MLGMRDTQSILKGPYPKGANCTFHSDNAIQPNMTLIASCIPTPSCSPAAPRAPLLRPLLPFLIQNEISKI